MLLFITPGHHQKKIWGEVIRFMVVLAVLRTIGYTFFPPPVLEAQLKMAFGRDAFSNYQVNLARNGTLVQLQGPFGFGISKAVKKLLEHNSGVTGIILDSKGGWVYEGRKLSKIILAYHLDTYSVKGCSSTCTTAYIAGDRRYIVKGAKLGFHEYYVMNNKLKIYFDQAMEQQKEQKFYRSRGIAPDFVAQVFKTDKTEIWYPAIEELLAAGVVNEILNAPDIPGIRTH